jgi:regulator of replication initiation timing
MNDKNIHSLSEDEYDFLMSIKSSVSSKITRFTGQIDWLKSEVFDLKKRNEELLKENDELKKKLMAKKSLFDFFPKIKNR